MNTDTNMTTSNYTNIEWCIARAENYARDGKYDIAIISFLSDVAKHPSTSHIAKNAFIVSCILNENKGNIDKFMEALCGFA